MSNILHGIECVVLKNEQVEIWAAKTMGPRILVLKAVGGQNLLAEVPDIALDHPKGKLYLRGGHRLWHAPESRVRTYIPDDQPPEIHQTADSLHLIQAVETETGIQKAIKLTLDGNGVKVEHFLTNHGLWPVTLAPWALTMLAPGGKAVFPETNRHADPDGLLPNRHLVLWPYAQFSDPRLKFTEYMMVVEVDPDNKKAFKFGYANTTGWQAYYQPYLRTWFVKSQVHDRHAAYPDMGCSAECYCNGDFVEMETLGPIVQLEPGQTVTHTESWQVWKDKSFDDLVHLV
ncbi:MAG: hypothetical protein KJ064_02270 [Anaerolineae bacterium]|nr:hypothetical protein [Anaerolineae bacterium]